MADLKGTKTLENLLYAFAGESMARNKYTYFASQARKDGYVQIAEIFEETAANEKEHEERYLKLLENVKEGKVFKKEEAVKWHCGNCGHVYEGDEAPEVCPVCAHPKSYFRVKAENY